MTIENLLLITIIILLVSALPLWPHSRQWGYAPTGLLGVVFIIFLLWVLMGNKPTTNVSHDIKNLGRDVTDSVRDAVK